MVRDTVQHLLSARQMQRIGIEQAGTNEVHVQPIGSAPMAARSTIPSSAFPAEVQKESGMIWWITARVQSRNLQSRCWRVGLLVVDLNRFFSTIPREIPSHAAAVLEISEVGFPNDPQRS